MLIMLVILNCPSDSSPSFPPKSFSFLDSFSELLLSFPPWRCHSHNGVDGGDINGESAMIDDDDD